jgi:peptidyl-prolyl cis-trans isomerase A (cyclophilin A)
MLKKLALAACALLFVHSLLAAENPRVLLTTSAGEIVVELQPDDAPLSVKNFLAYVDSGFYTDTIFHRVIPGFMIQGGGLDAKMNEKPTRAPIRNEADNGLRNVRGTLAMARTQAVDSATSQFFINQKDNPMLDHGTRDFGYAVFGRVVRGMEVVDMIVQLPTTRHGMFDDVPARPIFILSAKRL